MSEEASDPPRIISRWTLEEGRSAVEAWRSSGLSQASWCAQHGVSAKRLSYWKAIVEAPPDSGQGFVAVVAEQQAPALEVRVGSAIVVVGAPFDAAHLRAVVEALT